MLILVVNIRPAWTDHGMYYITRSGIWLLTKFHIPYIYFQRTLKKAIPPKLYLSFFVQYIFTRAQTQALGLREGTRTLTVSPLQRGLVSYNETQHHKISIIMITCFYFYTPFNARAHTDF